MTWAEFRRWAWEVYRFRITLRDHRTTVWAAVWQTAAESSRWDARNHKGSGREAVYGLREQRRFVAWLRCTKFIDVNRMNDWLTAAESYADGWLVNDGSGIRWIERPELEAHELVSRGFVAIKCGL